MSYFTIKPRQQQPDEKFNTTIQISRNVDDRLGPLLKSFCEIELLQGEREELPNNMVEYRMNLDEEKTGLFIQALNQVAFKINLSDN